MKKFEKIKQELLNKDVRLEGFATWLFIQASSERLGINPDLDHRKRYGMFAYERRWCEVYPWLKSKVDIDEFSRWLGGFPKPKDPFSAIGRGLANFFNYFRF